MLQHAVPNPEPIAPSGPRVHRVPSRGGAKRSLRRNIRISFFEGSAFSVMVGLGETYLPAFVLWMGLGNVFSGLITTVPLLFGSTLQLIAPTMVRKLGSYRKWVLICASIQGSIFLPLIACSLWGHLPVWVAFLCAGFYWAGGMGASGAWSSWMGTLIPPPVQVGFFTRRTRVTQATVFLGFAIGGCLLHKMPEYVDKSWAFVAIFAIAFSSRVVSLLWLRKQSEPVPPPATMNSQMGIRQFAQRLSRGHEQGRLFTYLLAVTFSAYLAAPYFTSYMLGEMQLAYSSYAILVACSYLGKILALPHLGRIASIRGTRPLLILGGTGIVSLPVLWLFSHQFGYLMGIQVLSGLTWGAFELASLLLIWELVKPEERTCAIATYNMANAMAMSVGSITGGILFTYFGAGGKAFAIIFALSTFCRAITVFWLRGVSSRQLHWVPIGFRTLSLRPGMLIPIVTQIKTWRERRQGRD